MVELALPVSSTVGVGCSQKGRSPMCWVGRVGVAAAAAQQPPQPRDLHSCAEDVALLTQLCEDACSKGGAGKVDTLFYLKTKASIPAFIDRLCSYLKCSFETLALGVLLTERWAAATRQTVNRDNIFRALFAATVVAVKTREDCFYTNAYYAHLWGLDIGIANALEERFLHAVDWDVYVSAEEYDAFLVRLRSGGGGSGGGGGSSGAGGGEGVVNAGGSDSGCVGAVRCASQEDESDCPTEESITSDSE
eukprot:Rhum_TRINITY_DN8565_c0_g1::Rhum_TRINITY_DN8565_c0_g1_i1::g.28724::m.28724